MTDSPHRVHGLAADQVVPDWPPLLEAEVDMLLAGYPQLGPVDGIAWHSPRPLSAACLAHTGAGTVFIKRHHQRVRTPSSLSEEHRFLEHLYRAGAAVPRVLANAQGATAVALGEWTYEVHAQAVGLDLYRDSESWSPLDDLAHARAAGAALGRLHRAATGYDAPQRSTHLLVARNELIAASDPVATLAAQLPQRPGLADYLHARDWRAELRALIDTRHATLPSRLQRESRLWTHNDWHVSNLYWSDAGSQASVSAVLDFGLASPTWAVFDLATAIERNAIAWLTLAQGHALAYPQTALALLSGYRETAALSADQVHLIADLLPLVHLDFALSEVEYFHAITCSPANAAVAYDTFLRGHTQWFDTTDGRALLEALHDDAV
ncbi:phosphotransferase enzyme family protein [Dyella tabacisoli]|uniref:Aminoglycoside phosphotransferase family protein n=1 Tax=Dyella tabacisoli TaxID=2282381 RepID=A0A369UP65_9GAMM|nr:phosphotransferase [Dyella tabacisoli]RDD81835.1 aminoglycoside phosphotransferase family protein [Dyella tabacisoli]